MGARLRVFLKEEEERTLKEMRQAENLGKRERDRAAAICLRNKDLIKYPFVLYKAKV